MKNFKSEKPKNDVIYVRVSSEEQVKNFSLGNQEKSCREFSEKAGYNVLQVFVEEGESAKTADRTKLQDMIRFCEKYKKQISRVVVYRVDRFSRNVADHHALKAILEKMEISLVSVTEFIDNTAMGRLSENMLSMFAQFDNDSKSERTIVGMKNRAMKGLCIGTAPWGYLNTGEKTENKMIVPDPQKAPIVKMLFEKYVTGKHTFRELAIMADKMGMRSQRGKKMAKQTVAKIIANQIYYGKIVVPQFGISVDGMHEPLVTEKIFMEAQARRSGKVGRKNPRNRDNPDFPLRGIQCDNCGKNITGGKTTGNGGKYGYYNCGNSECSARCHIPKKIFEDEFTKFLTELTPNEDFFDVLKEAIKLSHKSELNSVTTAEKKLNTEIAELRTKKERLLDLRIDGKISDTDFAPANQKCDSRLLELQRELSCLSSPELGVESMIDSGVEFLKHLPEIWKTLHVKDLRVLRTLLFPQNIGYAYPSIKTYELCSIYNIKSEFMSSKTHQVPPAGIEPAITA